MFKAEVGGAAALALPIDGKALLLRLLCGQRLAGASHPMLRQHFRPRDKTPAHWTGLLVHCNTPQPVQEMHAFALADRSKSS